MGVGGKEIYGCPDFLDWVSAPWMLNSAFSCDNFGSELSGY